MNLIRDTASLQKRLLHEVERATEELKRLPKDIHSWGTGEFQDHGYWVGHRKLANDLLMSIVKEP